MKKLIYIILLSISVNFLSCKLNKNVATGEKKKPNIIFILADDLASQAISAYGGIYKDIAPTPNMDKLADKGILFKNVMCTNSICGPSRATILTGKYSHINGYYKNESGGQFNPNQWTFPQEFQKNDYLTALFGKWHLGSEPRGFDQYMYHANSGQQGTYWDPLYNENGKKIVKKGYATNLTTDAAIQWLDNIKDSNKPFLMLLQYKAPHRPWKPDKKYEKLWDNIEMPYPATFNDDYKGREKTAGDTEMTMDYLSNGDLKLPKPKGLEGKELIKWIFYGTGKNEIVQPEGMSEEEGRKWRYQVFIKDYLACVKSIDDNIGRVLEYLDENGIADNTIIILTSDQGFYLGEHGFFDKRFIYEESLRMPFIVRYPKVFNKSVVNTDIISNIDFAPTLLNIAGIKTEEKMQGRSFAPLLKGKKLRNWRQSMYYHYYEFPYWHHVQPHYGIRTQRYTLAHFYYNIDVWELYDLQKDKYQLHNVYNNPNYKKVVVKLKKELKKLQKLYGDDLPLQQYRKITDTDFGYINKESEKINVRKILKK